MVILRAEFKDLQEILELQYLAYQSEAKLVGDSCIPPLIQTLENVECEFADGIIFKAIEDSDNIIGSVRAFKQDGTVHIGKLIVHPAFQGKGIGTALLTEVEKAYHGCRYELFTSNKSMKNLRLYERLGYSRFKTQEIKPGLTMIFLEKNTGMPES